MDTKETSVGTISTEQNKEFGQRFNELRKNKRHVDCSFKVGDMVFYCHKLILSAASPVFETMFYGSLPEKHIIKILDIKSGVFERLLDFIYEGAVDFDTMEDIEEILEIDYCAEKYMISSLHQHCMSYFNKNITHYNVLNLLDIAYTMNLDDIIYLCMCVLKHFLNSGMSLSNIILESSHHLSKDCVDFILENNYEFRDNIICLIRAWCITECELNHLKVSKDNIKSVLDNIEIPDSLRSTIVCCNYMYSSPVISGKCEWTPVQRVRYKAVRPLVIGDEMDFETSISTNRFIVIKSLNINSRMMPQKNLGNTRQETYMENLIVEIFTKCNKHRQIIYQKEHRICDVAFNDNLQLNLDEQIVLFPDIVYGIRFKWNLDSLGYEYPRSIFSTYGKNKQLLIHFSESVYFQNMGSILNCIVCDLYK